MKIDVETTYLFLNETLFAKDHQQNQFMSFRNTLEQL